MERRAQQTRRDRRFADLRFAILAACLLVVSGGGVAAQAQSSLPTGARLVLDAVPEKFERWQDRRGFAWQLTDTGSLLSGGVPYFQGVMKLAVDGQSFGEGALEAVRLDGGEVTAAGARVVLSGAAGGIHVARDVWFDAGRSGVRYLDRFENPDAQPALVEVRLVFGYQSSWQDLHAPDGRVLGQASGAGLRPRDAGLLVRFSQAEGRHDTLLLVGDDGDALKPELSFSENHRELVLTHRLEIPAGGEVALVHWVMQRGLRSERDAEDELRDFYLRRRLIDGGIPAEVAPTVANFSVRPAGAAPEPGQLAELRRLNAMLASYGAQRGQADVLWLSDTSQIAGTVEGPAALQVAGRFGVQEVPLAEIAAIRGGGGIGATPRVFLRDGRVIVGEIRSAPLRLVSPDGVAMDALDPATIELVWFRLGADDGIAATVDAGEDGSAGRPMMVALRSGEVVAVSAGENSSLLAATPWGEIEVPFAEIDSVHYERADVPAFRLHLADGSRLSAFLTGLTGGVVQAFDGAVGPRDLEAMWRIGAGDAEAGDSRPGHAGESWLAVEDAGSIEALNLPMALLRGNNLIHAEVAPKSFHLVAEGSVSRVAAEEIVAIQRLDSGDVSPLSASLPKFEIELRGGDRLRGQLREHRLEFRGGGRTWRVPVAHLVGYRGERAE